MFFSLYSKKRSADLNKINKLLNVLLCLSLLTGFVIPSILYKNFLKILDMIFSFFSSLHQVQDFSSTELLIFFSWFFFFPHVVSLCLWDDWWNSLSSLHTWNIPQNEMIKKTTSSSNIYLWHYKFFVYLIGRLF